MQTNIQPNKTKERKEGILKETCLGTYSCMPYKVIKIIVSDHNFNDNDKKGIILSFKSQVTWQPNFGQYSSGGKGINIL